MVKAGIYLLMRLAPTLGDTALWETALVGIGLLTMLMGAAFALRQRDLKGALAYSTISQLGAIVALVGLPHGEGTQAALITILAHGLYKAALFMVAGAVDHTTGTRDLGKLGGLFKPMRGWAIVTVIAGISMAGLPPMLGFVAKEGLLEAMHASPVALAVIVVSAALTVTMALILTRDVFWGVVKGDHHHLHLTPNAMLVGPAVLAGGSLVTGLALEPLITPLLVPFFGPDLHLYLFHGINLPLVLSTIAIIAGVVVFALRDTWRSWAWFGLPQGTKVYQSIMGSVESLGDRLLRIQAGKLRYYLVVILCAVIALQATAGFGHLSIHTIQFPFNPTTDILRTVLLVMALGAIFASVLTRNHLLAALALGLSGYAIGGLFLVEPAPDVALVQFMVETVGTVLLIVMLSRISADQRQQAMDTLRTQTRAGLTRDIVISLTIGAAVGVFALAAMESRPKPEAISTWHIENAAAIGIPDVVGAIVTDFRGMDTMVEISVFSVAALGVLTLLTTRRRTNITHIEVIRNESADPTLMHHEVSEADPEEEDRPVSRFSTPLTRIMSQAILPVAFIVSMVHLLYGGEQPGDGFTAGVISGLGVALSYIVFGYHDSQGRLGWLKPRVLIGGGLALVIVNAAFPMLTGSSFLAHLSLEGVYLPAHLHLSTTLVYETGIFLTVLGSVSTIMEAIAYPKEAEPL
jgi:multisubunit Na+/H+ antiporter MnhB subunit